MTNRPPSVPGGDAEAVGCNAAAAGAEDLVQAERRAQKRHSSVPTLRTLLFERGSGPEPVTPEDYDQAEAELDSLEEQYQALHLAAEAVFRSGYEAPSGMRGRYVNGSDMDALGAVLYSAKRQDCS